MFPIFTVRIRLETERCKYALHILQPQGSCPSRTNIAPDYLKFVRTSCNISQISYNTTQQSLVKRHLYPELTRGSKTTGEPYTELFNQISAMYLIRSKALSGQGASPAQPAGQLVKWLFTNKTNSEYNSSGPIYNEFGPKTSNSDRNPGCWRNNEKVGEMLVRARRENLS